MAKVNIYDMFEKRIMPFLKKGRREQEKLIYYLKLYSHLLSAMNELRSRRGFDRLRIVLKLTSKESFSGESHYLKYIGSITRDALANQKRIQGILAKDPTADPLHTKTRLMIAQNICILRILKLNY
jgi:hypothetical protein